MPPMKLFFGNLPAGYPEGDLKDLVAKYGKTQEVAVRDDKEGSRCFGFVEFENEDDARDCQKSEDGMKIDGRIIRVEVKSGARGGGDRDRDDRGGGMERRAPRGRPTRTLFVGSINPDAREADLEDAFHRYGRLAGIRMMTNKRGPGGRQLAFVEFENLNDAEDAMDDAHRITVLKEAVRLDYDAGVGGRGGPPARGGGGYRRSPPRDRYRRSPSPDRYRRRSYSRSPPRRSPPRRRSYTPSRSRTPPRRRRYSDSRSR